MTLNLRANLIGNDGAQYLSDALKNNTVRHNVFIQFLYIHCYYLIQTLTTLVLYLNQIGDQGAQHLADALQINTVRNFSFLVIYLWLLFIIDTYNIKSLS